MKLKELLQACDFEEVMATIDDMFGGTAKFRAPLKEAYDLLLQTEPVFSKKSIRYKIMTDPENDEEYMGAEDANFATTWEVCLGKEVVREKGVDLSDLEIAANCLVNLCLVSRYPRSFEEAHRQLLQ